jgi:hypothetical protein
MKSAKCAQGFCLSAVHAKVPVQIVCNNVTHGSKYSNSRIRALLEHSEMEFLRRN